MAKSGDFVLKNPSLFLKTVRRVEVIMRPLSNVTRVVFLSRLIIMTAPHHRRERSQSGSIFTSTPMSWIRRYISTTTNVSMHYTDIEQTFSSVIIIKQKSVRES